MALFASLRSRRLELDAAVARRWRGGEAASHGVQLNDWIRRVSLAWPLVAAGTSRGGVVVADLCAGSLVAQDVNAHPGRASGSSVASGMRLLHGEYDGGGLTAVALVQHHPHPRLATAGRDCGVRLWHVDGDELMPLGRLGPEEVLVSAVEIAPDGASLWAAGLDGAVRRFDDPFERSASRAPALTLRCPSPVLAIATSDELSVVACASAAGAVHLFDLSDGRPRGVWKAFGFEEAGDETLRIRRGERARSVAFVERLGGWSVVAGGSNGGVCTRPVLRPTAAGEAVELFDEALPGARLEPDHGGPVVSLAAVCSGNSVADSNLGTKGLFVSGAHDGTLRVWDLEPDGGRGGDSPAPGKPLYGLGGFKVWLGSVQTDGRRIVSDGRDNVVAVHDFSGDKVGSPLVS